MGPDGISYLDIGDAYLRGDWYVAVNAMWSPFYSWLAGFWLMLFKPFAILGIYRRAPLELPDLRRGVVQLRILSARAKTGPATANQRRRRYRNGAG